MNRWGFLGAGRKRLRGRSETKIWRSLADLISHTGAADEINLTCAAVIVNKLMLMLLVSPVFACYGEEEKGQTAFWVSHECKYCDVTMAIKTADFSTFIQKLLDNSVYQAFAFKQIKLHPYSPSLWKVAETWCFPFQEPGSSTTASSSWIGAILPLPRLHRLTCLSSLAWPV